MSDSDEVATAGRRRLAGGFALGMAVALVTVPITMILTFAEGDRGGGWWLGTWATMPTTLAEAAPWFIGAVLLQVRRVRLATAVLLTAAAIQVVWVLPYVAFAVLDPSVVTAPGGPVQLLTSATFTVLAVTTAWLVWSSRPAALHETVRSPRRAVPRFVGPAAGLVALTAVFLTGVPVGPGGREPRDWFATTIGWGHFTDVSMTLWTLLPAVLVIGATMVAYRIGGAAAGAILLTVAGPRLVSEVVTHLTNLTALDGMITPAGGLVLIGLVGLIAGGLSLIDAPDGEDPAGRQLEDPVDAGDALA